jgi:hypothetical protein
MHTFHYALTRYGRQQSVERSVCRAQLPCFSQLSVEEAERHQCE